jgi:hypothetical protein
MTAALQIVEAVQTILVESNGTSVTLDVSSAGISGPRGFTGPQGPPGPPGPLSALTDLSDVALATPEGGDVLTYSSPTTTWINEKAARLVDGGNF